MNGGFEPSAMVPVSNELENLPELPVRLVKTLDKIGLQSYELIFVVDGGVNASYAHLQRLSIIEVRVRTIKFTLNVGKYLACSVALEGSTGHMVIRTRFPVRCD
jgi:polyisoprenyl-phosphate glycosyltransferase